MDLDQVETRIFFSTVRLRSDVSVGTGFIVGVGTGDRVEHLVATARHVVEGTQSMSAFLVAGSRGRPNFGTGVEIAVDGIEDRWVAHPNRGLDLAVFPITDLVERVEPDVYFRHVATESFCTFDDESQLGAIEDVTVIGYPNGIYDPVNHTPIARRGTTATPPALDYGGLPSFMIDASVFGGSSGSPVYRIRQSTGTATDSPGQMRAELLGITVAAKAKPSATLATDRTDRAQPSTTEMIDLGIVIKAPPLRELIELVTPGDARAHPNTANDLS